jgi:hypothetical protein
MWRNRALLALLFALTMIGLGAATPALARSFDRFQFRVNVATGKARQLWAGSGSAATSPREALSDARLPAAPRFVTQGGLGSDAGTAIIRDRGGAVLLRVPMSNGEHDWSPWAVLHSSLVVFAWRDQAPAPAAPNTSRDVWTAFDLRDGRPLWRRERPLEADSWGAAALNDGAVVVDGPAQIEIIDSRSGVTLRKIPKSDRAFSLTTVLDGLLVEAGDHLHFLDRKTAADRWLLRKRGALIAWTPIPRQACSCRAAEIALLHTRSATYMVDSLRGRILWESPGNSASEPWVVGARVYEPTLKKVRQAWIAGLVVRRLRDGVPIGNHVVQRQEGFFDGATVKIIGVRGHDVDVETSFIVLD